MTRIVILGTGTDVGKTYVTAHLAQALATHPKTAGVLALKPIESGVHSHPANLLDITADRPLQPSQVPTFPRSDPESDAALLARTSSPPLQTVGHAYAFADPVSPHLAARRANVMIDVKSVANWVTNAEQPRQALHYTTLHVAPTETLGENRAWTLVETAGAVFSPLTRGVTNLDLAIQLEPAIWILVAPDRLGVLHDLTVTLCALRQFGRLPDSIVLCQSAHSDPSTGTNAYELRDLEIAEIDMTVERHASIPPGYTDRLVQLADARRL